MDESTKHTNDDLQDRLRRLELENLRLKTELEARKAGQKTQAAIGRVLSRATSNYVAGKGLKKSVKKLLEELPGKPSNDTISDVAAHLVWRITRIGTFALMVAAAPLLIMVVQTYILNMQNEKLEMQNQLLGRQNSRLDQQINLEEGNRRSSLVFFMSNIMDRIDDELADNPDRILSDALIGRIVSLSQALRPYRYLENDELTDRQLSPERGQLLFSLINSNLNEKTYDKIYASANFNYADLREANFTNAYMKGAQLANSFFYKANFNDANLEHADLSLAYLEEAVFIRTKMDSAKLKEANLHKSVMSDISLRGGSLEKADLREISLKGDFRGTYLEGVIIQDAILSQVDLRDCYFRSLSWIDSLQNYRLKGFASLVEYYEPEMVIRHEGFNTDTTYRLRIDKRSPFMWVMECTKYLRMIIDSSPEISTAIRPGNQGDEQPSVSVIALPYDTGNKQVRNDTSFQFNISAARGEKDSVRIQVQFNPIQKKLWEIYPDGRPPKELSFDRTLLYYLDEKCMLGR